MAESHDHEHGSQRQQRGADPPSYEECGAPEKLDEGNRETHGPERPHRQEGVLVRQKPLADVARGSERKDLVDAGHEENEPEDEPGKEDCPRARPPNGITHRFRTSCSNSRMSSL